MFKGLGDMAKLMQQARQMQEKLAEAQERVAQVEAEGEAGAGMVKARVSGKGELRKLTVDPALMNPQDIETLEDLVIAAVNAAHARAQEAAQAEMAKVTEGMTLPPGMKLPF
ncbi:MAG: YbaB/EbfC family nucleoid-associated protein [Rubrimonas sp.]